MTNQEQRAVLTVCLLAAFADGGGADIERSEIKRIAEGFSAPDFNLTQLYQDVLMRRVSVETAAKELASDDSRRLAYEMAVCVCDADGARNASEDRFLDSLRRELGLDESAVAGSRRTADDLAAVPLAAAIPPPIPANASAAVADAEIDKSVLNYSILNGALELLPNSLATMAIIPLQMKMVYAIGKRHGYELDRGHIKELLAAVGVGLTSQVVEGYASKLLKGLAGKFAGSLGRAVVGQMTSTAFSFATTYALGQLAKRYYAGGRTMSGLQLKGMFDGLLGEARTLQSRYLPAIQERSRNINMSEILPLVRGL